MKKKFAHEFTPMKLYLAHVKGGYTDERIHIVANDLAGVEECVSTHYLGSTEVKVWEVTLIAEAVLIAPGVPVVPILKADLLR